MQELLAIGLTLLMILIALVPVAVIALISWAAARFDEIREGDV
jgi:hypothetical protein